MSNRHECECGTTVDGATAEAFEDAFLAHVRARHADWPYPDVAVRNFAAATQRLSNATTRLDTIGQITVHPVTDDRIDDWLTFFDRDAFAGNPAWAACYCLEPHVVERDTAPDQVEHHPWRANREAMTTLMRSSRCFGYLAYVDDQPAGWVNASNRSAYALYRMPGSVPSDGDVVAIACYVVAPPYRRHGLAAALLERVLRDAPGRGAAWVEAYPANGEGRQDAGNFRGPRSLYEANGFEEIERRERYTVMRRRA
jgi:GNAT superfamily N-acetyltransferase